MTLVKWSLDEDIHQLLVGARWEAHRSGRVHRLRLPSFDDAHGAIFVDRDIEGRAKHGKREGVGNSGFKGRRS